MIKGFLGVKHTSDAVFGLIVLCVGQKSLSFNKSMFATVGSLDFVTIVTLFRFNLLLTACHICSGESENSPNIVSQFFSCPSL